MKENEIKDLQNLLKSALPPPVSGELRRDLWPAMRQRLEKEKLTVPWWDWALLAGVAAAFCFFPGLIPALL